MPRTGSTTLGLLAQLFDRLPLVTRLIALREDYVAHCTARVSLLGSAQVDKGPPSRGRGRVITSDRLRVTRVVVHVM